MLDLSAKWLLKIFGEIISNNNSTCSMKSLYLWVLMREFFAWMPEFLCNFFFNCFSDLRSLMPFMNLQKKSVNGNQMRKMKFRLVLLSLVCFILWEYFFYCAMDMSADEPLLAWHCLYPNLLFPCIFVVLKVYRFI